MIEFFGGAAIFIVLLIYLPRIIKSLLDISHNVGEIRKNKYRLKRGHQHLLEQQANAVEAITKDMETMTHAFKCPSCGASFTVDPKHVSSYCSFCGAPLPNADELVKLSFDYADKQEQRKYELEKLRQMETDFRKKERSKNMPVYAILVFGVIGLLFIVLFPIIILHR